VPGEGRINVKTSCKFIAFSVCLPVAAAFAGCATARQPVAGDLTADELSLIHSVSKRSPMKLVTNETPEGAARLALKSDRVNPADPELKRLVERLFATVMAENGVGIAAPQVGVPRRVILVKRLDREPEKPFVAYFNPEIKRPSLEKAVEWEGCLSVPEGYGRVARAVAITVEYDNLDGGRSSERVEGYVARIFQHEIDHLNGILFIERKEPGKLIPKDKFKEMRAREKSVACLLEQ
jgi:peptide deformylase